MIKIEEIFEKILKNKDKMILYRGVTNECISKYESNNKMYIPDEYKSWLKFSNGGELFVPGTILFGIESDVSPIDQEKTLRYANRSEIRKRMFSIPLSYLVVGKLNFGDFICIDLNNENNTWIANRRTAQTIRNIERNNEMRRNITKYEPTCKNVS